MRAQETSSADFRGPFVTKGASESLAHNRLDRSFRNSKFAFRDKGIELFVGEPLQIGVQITAKNFLKWSCSGASIFTFVHVDCNNKHM